MNLLLSRLDEQQRRWYVAVEAEKIGHGGTEQMALVAGININGKYFFVIDALTDMKSLQILPFLKGGVAFRVGAIPGTPQAGGGKRLQFGKGPSFGAGIMFLIKKYVYLGIDLQEDLLFMDSISQTVGGVSQEVYSGGFKPQFGATAILGVHF